MGANLAGRGVDPPSSLREPAGLAKISAMDDEEQQLAQLGALKAEASEDYPDEDPLDADHDLDLELHDPPPEHADAVAVAKPEQVLVDRGQFALTRSAEGLELMNTLEVLPPFELSI